MCTRPSRSNFREQMYARVVTRTKNLLSQRGGANAARALMNGEVIQLTQAY